MLSGFGHLLIASVLSKKQSPILGHLKSDWDTPPELINIRKVCSDILVAILKLLECQAGAPPDRRFQWEPQGWWS